MSPTPLSLALGFLLGGSAVWFATRPAPPPPPAAALPFPPVTLATWSWRASAVPPPLAGDTMAGAIAAWLALRGPDGTPAALPLRAEALRALLARLPAAGFPRLLTPLAARTGPDDRRLLQGAFDVWVELDPIAAARWAGTVADSPGLDRFRLARQAAREWVKLDVAAVLEWAGSLPDETLASSLLSSFAEKDPARALAVASARSESFFAEVLPSLLQPLAKTNPAAALRTYGPGLWKNGEGFWTLRETIGQWVAREPAAAFSWLLAQPRRSDSELANWLGNLGIGNNGSRAALASALATVPGLPGRQSALGHFLFDWGAEQPDEALAWLNALPDRHLRTVLLERAARITYSEHPERSLPLALAMSEGANRTQRLSDLLGQWAKREPSAALAWIREHDDPGVAVAAADAHAAILGTIARDEPATALAEWKALPEGAARQAAIAPIAQAWARTDPGAALQWLSEQETAASRGTVHTDLIYSWAQKDPLAALRWAETAAIPQTRFGYLKALAGTWQEKADRTSTADLYVQIQDPALRANVLTEHLREWLTKDRPAARAWLESHDTLSPAEAAALLAENPGLKR